MQIKYRNIQVALEGVQSVDNDKIYFTETIMTNFHGTKMKDWLSINEISLTCVALKKILKLDKKKKGQIRPNQKTDLLFLILIT